MATTSESTQQDTDQLTLLIRGFQISRMIRAVAERGLADQIDPDRPALVRDLATVSGWHPALLFRLFRALAAFGVFTVDQESHVGHSRLSLLLRSDAHPGLSASACFYPASCDWLAWDALDMALEGRGIPFEQVWSKGRFAYMQEHQDHARLFDRVMADAADSRFTAVASTSASIRDDFDGLLIADIGGGNGAMLRALLARHTGASGLLYEREPVLRNTHAEDFLNGRIIAQAGDFLTHIPPKADIYLLSRILHDWDDETCLKILRLCRAAMSPGTQLWIVERLLATDPAECNPHDALIDMQMMVALGGQERSLAEFQALLDASGFHLAGAWRTLSATSIIVAHGERQPDRVPSHDREHLQEAHCLVNDAPPGVVHPVVKASRRSQAVCQPESAP
jgi:hypothetical protein